jgi:hypothetical protein
VRMPMRAGVGAMPRASLAKRHGRAVLDLVVAVTAAGLTGSIRAVQRVGG